MVIPDRGDIAYLDFRPQSAHEQSGRRPALVLSPYSYNAKTKLPFVIPISSKDKGFPLHIQLQGTTKIQGFALIEHLRSVDFAARNGDVVDRVDTQTVDSVLAILQAVFE